MTLRIGHGIDAHRLIAGRPLMLGGVEIEYDRGLLGHSDGDAVAHALCDALLGAAGLGDIGTHFPSDAEAWRGAAGAQLLTHVGKLVAGAGFTLESAHVVIVAEEPRLQPHLETMKHAMASALGAEPQALGLTATTTDGMGFAGRGEGIAASAVAILRPTATADL